MLICDSHLFVFIHVHRTGGTSLTEIFETMLPGIRRVLPQHTHAGLESFDLELLTDYFVFAFIRNPWDRLYSWYCLFSEYNPRKSQETFSLEKFIQDYSTIARNYGLDENFRFNQVDYLRDNKGDLVTTFLGRYETYARDAARVFRKVGLRVGSIPRLNATNRSGYQIQYSKKARELVADLCAADIEQFGYRFDGF